MRLQNKVIIVTGSTTGIGKAIAIRCVVHPPEDSLPVTLALDHAAWDFEEAARAKPV